MSDQGPVVVISSSGLSSLGDALAAQTPLTIRQVGWADACESVAEHHPAAILVQDGAAAAEDFPTLAAYAATLRPYVPLFAIGTAVEAGELQVQCVPDDPRQVQARLQSALRVRADEAAVMRRLAGDEATLSEFQSARPMDDAVVLLAGRGRDYPALSVRLGGHVGVIGCLSLEAAAQQLRARDVDGVLIGGGFGPRHVEALLIAMTEDSRFRNLPVVCCAGRMSEHDGEALANLVMAEPDEAIGLLLPMVAQQARLAHLRRTMAAIDAEGRLDARTGLMAPDTFAREFMRALNDAQARGGALSAALFAFETDDRRVLTDAARILARLMRGADFAAQESDGSILAVFTETNLTSAHVVARRLASVLKHTLVSGANAERIVPNLTLATMKAGDNAQTMLARLMPEPARAAS